MQTKAKLLDLPLARLPVRVLVECRTRRLVERRISMSAYQRQVVPDSAASGDSLPGNSSSGCTISLMAHFRLHHRYRALDEDREETAFEK